MKERKRLSISPATAIALLALFFALGGSAFAVGERVQALTVAGYAVDSARDGEEGFYLGDTEPYDIIILDLGLPKMDGISILEQWRRANRNMPVIILTACGREADRVEGLRRGADDYVVKPFSVKELLARVAAVLRRSPERPTDVAEVVVACGVADMARLEVRYSDGRRAELSEREAQLLRYLACNPGRAISREEILARVWRLDPKGIETRTIDMHVARLRDKLRDDPSSR